METQGLKEAHVEPGSSCRWALKLSAARQSPCPRPVTAAAAKGCVAVGTGKCQQRQQPHSHSQHPKPYIDL